MIYLELFLTFLKIGAVAFGGGYAMIPLIMEDCLAHGWMSEAELLNFVAVSESTPGPIAVNIATFIGSSQGGILGAFLATLGIILPAFIIILLVATVLTKVIKYKGVQKTFDGIRPAVVSLITATGVIMFSSIIFNFKTIGNEFIFDYKSLIIFGIITLTYIVISKIRKKALSPIILIVLSGILGVIFFGI